MTGRRKRRRGRDRGRRVVPRHHEDEAGVARLCALARLVCRYEDLEVEDVRRVLRAFCGPLPAGFRIGRGVLTRAEERELIR